MTKWYIDIFLKGSNTYRLCIYTGPEQCSSDVMKKLFHGKNPNDWVDLMSVDENVVTYVTVSEIASVDIYLKKEGN